MSEDATAALQGLARDLVIELAETKAAEILALAAGQPGREVAPEHDPQGQFRPPPPGPQAGWHHTLRNPAHRSHLLGSDPFMQQLYGRAAGPGRVSAQAAHWGAEGQQEPSGGQGEAQGQGDGIPPEGLAEGQRAGQQARGGVGRDAAGHPQVGSDARGAVDGGDASGSGDLEMIVHPAGPAARPVRRPPKNMFGQRYKRLTYRR